MMMMQNWACVDRGCWNCLFCKMQDRLPRNKDGICCAKGLSTGSDSGLPMNDGLLQFIK